MEEIYKVKVEDETEEIRDKVFKEEFKEIIY
jgi:hypothetical protein